MKISAKGLLKAVVPAIGVVAVAGGIGLAILIYGLEPDGFLRRLLESPFGDGIAKLVLLLDSDNVFILLATLVLALYVGILIHEVGHVLAGLFVRYPFKSVTVGPFTMSAVDGGWTLKIEKPNLSGMALHLRAGRKRGLKTAFFALGGPMANALTFTAAPYVLEYHSTFLSALCLISLFLCVSNLIPFYTSGFASDGMVIWRALRSSKQELRDSALRRLAPQLGKVRPREYRRTWIQKSIAFCEPTQGSFIAHWLAYLHYNDAEQWDLAASMLETCLELSPAAGVKLQKLCVLEAAVFHAWALDDLEGALRWKARVADDSAFDPSSVLRWNIVLATAYRDPSALTLWESGLETIREHKDEHARELLNKSWLEFRDDIERRLKSAPGQGATLTPDGQLVTPAASA